MSNNNEKNGGSTPAESQEAAARQLADIQKATQELTELALSLQGIPAKELSRLPGEVAGALAKAKEDLAAERAKLERERSEHNEHVASFRDEYASILPVLRGVMDAAAKAHKREAKSDAIFSTISLRLDGIEGSISNGSVNMASGFGQMLEVFDQYREVSAIQYTDQMKISRAIESKIDSGFFQMTEAHGNIQSSVDRIGIMMNRMMDFTTHVRDLMLSSQETVNNIDGQVVALKGIVFQTSKALGTDLSKKIEILPESIKNRVSELNYSVNQMKSVSRELTEKVKSFSGMQEVLIQSVEDRLSDLKELYDSHVRTMNSGLKTQLGLMSNTMSDKTEDIMEDLAKAFKKSDIFKLVSEVHKMSEELTFAQSGLKGLLDAIKDEETSIISDLREASDEVKSSLFANARGVHDQLHGMSVSADESLLALKDLGNQVGIVYQALDKTKDVLNKVASDSGQIASASTSGAIALAQEFMVAIKGAMTDLDGKLTQHITTEHEITRSSGFLGALGADDQGEG